MVTQRVYQRLTHEQVKGRRVRTLVTLWNSLSEIPAGTLMTIIAKSKGYSLMGDPCPHCGVRVAVGRVQPSNVEFVDEGS